MCVCVFEHIKKETTYFIWWSHRMVTTVLTIETTVAHSIPNANVLLLNERTECDWETREIGKSGESTIKCTRHTHTYTRGERSMYMDIMLKYVHQNSVCNDGGWVDDDKETEKRIEVIALLGSRTCMHKHAEMETATALLMTQINFLHHENNFWWHWHCYNSDK